MPHDLARSREDLIRLAVTRVVCVRRSGPAGTGQVVAAAQTRMKPMSRSHERIPWNISHRLRVASQSCGGFSASLDTARNPSCLLLDPHPGQGTGDDQLLDLLGALEYVVGVHIAFSGNGSQAIAGFLSVHYLVVRPLSARTSPKLVLLRPVGRRSQPPSRSSGIPRHEVTGAAIQIRR